MTEDRGLKAQAHRTKSYCTQLFEGFGNLENGSFHFLTFSVFVVPDNSFLVFLASSSLLLVAPSDGDLLDLFQEPITCTISSLICSTHPFALRAIYLTIKNPALSKNGLYEWISQTDPIIDFVRSVNNHVNGHVSLD
jgi:hypothetical protein